MKIKSYFAPTVESAMNLARQELGPDAMLLSSRKSMPESKGVGEFEVVFALGDVLAACDPAPKSTDAERFSSEIAELRRQMEQMASRLQRASSVSVSNLMSNPELAAIFSSLIASDVSAALAQQIISGVRARPEASARALIHAAVREEVASLFHVDPTLGCPSCDKKVVALVGPPGAGKTTVLAKLAVRFGLMTRRSSVILSADVDRIAAADQLQSYASILGMGFQIVEPMYALRQALEEHGQKELVLVDTPGYAPGDIQAAEPLAKALADGIDVHLVLPATMKSADLSRTVDRFGLFNVSKLIFTRLDETETYGTLLNEAARTGKPVSFLNAGQQVPEDLITPSRNGIIDLVLGQNRTVSTAAAA